MKSLNFEKMSFEKYKKIKNKDNKLYKNLQIKKIS